MKILTMPKPKYPPLTTEERERIIHWLQQDLGKRKQDENLNNIKKDT